MPKLQMTTAHDLGQEEAARRLRQKFDHVRAQFQGQVSELVEQWRGHVLDFGFKTMGMKVAGTVTVTERAVDLAAELPLAAMMFRGMIESRLRAELAEILG